MCKNLSVVDGCNIDGAEISLSRSDDTEDDGEDDEEDDFI